jgi:fatty-acyl-CoA synthase
MAFVVRKPDSNVMPEAVLTHLLRQVDSKRLSKYAVPELDRIAFVPEIPKTSVGKINKKVLRERHA